MSSILWLWTKHCNSISTRVVSITLGQPLNFKKLYNLIHIHSCKKKEKTHNLKCIKSLSNQIWTTTTPHQICKTNNSSKDLIFDTNKISTDKVIILQLWFWKKSKKNCQYWLISLNVNKWLPPLRWTGQTLMLYHQALWLSSYDTDKM